MRKMAKDLALLFASILLSLLLLELGSRVLFAFRAGPWALLYGMGYARVVRDGPRWDQIVAAEDKGKHYLKNEVGTYSKFLPRQYRSLAIENPDQKVAVVSVPGVSLYPVIANNYGFRGKDFEKTKGEGVARVITLGASSTYGYHNRDDETFPYYLEAYLNEALRETPCGDVESFEVLNFGIPHANSQNIHALLVGEAPDFDPDIVTFYEGANDTRRIHRSAAGRMALRVAAFSIVAKYLVYLWDDQFESFSESDVQHYMEGKREFFLEQLSGINQFCVDRDILFVVASQEAKSFIIKRELMRHVTYADEVTLVRGKLDDDHRLGIEELQFLIHADIMQGLREWVAANDVPFVDIIRVFDEHEMRDQLLSWVHLTAKANRLVASHLGKAILENFCGSPRSRRASLRADR